MVITYQHVLTRLNFHFESTSNIIYFKITQREKNKIGGYIYFYWGITNLPVFIGRTFFYGGLQIRRKKRFDHPWRDLQSPINTMKV